MIPSNVLFLDRNLNIGVCSSQFFKSILVLPWSSKIGIPLYMELYCKKLWDITMPNLGQKKMWKIFSYLFSFYRRFWAIFQALFFVAQKKNKLDLRFVEERVETLINWFKGISFVKTKNTTDGVMWFNSVYTIALKTKDEGYESYYSKL